MDLVANQQIAELGMGLADAAVRNTAGAIAVRISTAKAKKNDKETIQELEEIVNALVSDRNELVRIAQAYEQELVAQKISESDIEYITTNFVPVLRQVIGGTSAMGAEQQLTMNMLMQLISVETLTVLQLLGFNFKKAIGEPLTILLQRAIMAHAGPDPANEKTKAVVGQKSNRPSSPAGH